MAREFRLPDLGEGITEGQIVRILCREGDQIAEEQPLMEVETDKAAVEIPSPFAGVAAKVHVAEGQTVAVGQVLVTFGEAEGVVEKKKAPAATGRVEERGPTPAASAPAPAPAVVAAVASQGPATRVAAAPAVRKFAREVGVDIDTLTGTGPGGRVVRADVEAAAARGSVRSAPAGAAVGVTPAPPAAAAAVAASIPVIEGTAGTDQWGSIKRQKLTQIRKTIAAQMVRSVSTIPHVTHIDDADVTELEAVRQQLRGEDGSGPRVTMMGFLVRAIAHCLRVHPWFNASFDAEHEEVVYKEYINIGIAVDSPRGLVVPVIRHADRLSVLGIMQELSALTEKVRNARFAIDELRGGTFTITNYGSIGGTYGTPVINHPESAILGVGRLREQLRLQDDELETRLMLPLSLSFDHRLNDGAQAARFMNDVIAHLSNPGLLMIK